MDIGAKEERVQDANLLSHFHTETVQTYEVYKNISAHYDRLNEQTENEIHAPIRSVALKAVSGNVLEVGVGTGNNLAYYSRENVQLTAVDLTTEMISFAKKKVPDGLNVKFFEADAAKLTGIESDSYDWVVSFFTLCVMPKPLLPDAIKQIVRVLKEGGRFCIIEIIESKNPENKAMQDKVNREHQIFERYALDVTNDALGEIEKCPDLIITHTEFVHSDTYLRIEGIKKSGDSRVE